MADQGIDIKMMALEDGTVYVQIPTGDQVTFMQLLPDQARALAASLIACADEAALTPITHQQHLTVN